MRAIFLDRTLVEDSILRYRLAFTKGIPKPYRRKSRKKVSANYGETSGRFQSGNEVITEIVGEVRNEK
jgi:hypothetical protein